MEREDLEQVAQGLDRILGDAPLETIDANSGLGAEADALWAMLTENGYPLVSCDEEHGGFGAAIADAARLAQVGARHALALPMGDTMLALGLLSRAGLEPSEMKCAVADPLEPGAPVPYAMQAEAALTLGNGQMRLVQIERQSLCGGERAEDGAALLSDGGAEEIASLPAPNWLSALNMRALGALMRAAQMAGAMQAVLDLTLGYTQQREQFGRPLAKFQAIQHHLSDIACETAASIAAVELACDALRADPECGLAVIEDIAIAKIRCGEAAARVAAAAHQAHGAMGFTREYALGRFTRRLWQWQDEFGSEAEWSCWLGNQVLGADTPSLWPRISRPV